MKQVLIESMMNREQTLWANTYFAQVDIIIDKTM